MSSPTHKNQSPSTKPNRTPSANSEDSVFQSSKSRKFSVPSFETVKSLQQKRGSVAGFPNSRKGSVPFPVTEYVSKWRKSVRSGSTDSVENTSLKHSKSEDNLNRNIRRGSNPWRVFQLVVSAKKRFTGEEQLPKNSTLSRRPSLSDFLKIATLKRSDTHKRRMVRLLKQRVLQNKQVTTPIPNSSCAHAHNLRTP